MLAEIVTKRSTKTTAGPSQETGGRGPYRGAKPSHVARVRLAACALVSLREVRRGRLVTATSAGPRSRAARQVLAVRVRASRRPKGARPFGIVRLVTDGGKRAGARRHPARP